MPDYESNDATLGLRDAAAALGDAARSFTRRREPTPDEQAALEEYGRLSGLLAGPVFTETTAVRAVSPPRWVEDAVDEGALLPILADSPPGLADLKKAPVATIADEVRRQLERSSATSAP